MERKWECTMCGLAVKGNEDKFVPDVTRVGQVSSYCRECFNKRRANKRAEKRRALAEHGLLGQMAIYALDLKHRANCIAVVSDVTAEQLLTLWERFGAKCCSCGSVERIRFSNIIPLEDGGEMSAFNLQVLCRACEFKRGCFGVDFTVRPPVIRSNPINAVMAHNSRPFRRPKRK